MLKKGLEFSSPYRFVLFFCLLIFAIVESLKNISGTYRLYLAANNRTLLFAARLQAVVIENFRLQRDAINRWQWFFPCLQLISRHLLLPLRLFLISKLLKINFKYRH